MTTVLPATTDDALEQLIAVRAALDRYGAGPTLDDLHHSLEQGRRYFVAAAHEDVAGCAMIGSHVSGDHVYADVSVLPDRRGEGVGSALFAAVAAVAVELGAEGLTGEVWDDDPESLAWVERRGFAEVERQLALALDLNAVDVVPPTAPDGVRIVTLADLGDDPPLEAMWRVALEANEDIPGLDSEEPRSFDDWRAHEIDRPSRDPRFSFLALAGDEVIGVAALETFSGGAFHGLTGVVRAWRGRGVAEALKRAEIAAAKAAGFERLLTESQHSNEPMRRLNEKLGFRPIPGTIVVRGPLPPRD